MQNDESGRRRTPSFLIHHSAFIILHFPGLPFRRLLGDLAVVVLHELVVLLVGQVLVAAFQHRVAAARGDRAPLGGLLLQLLAQVGLRVAARRQGRVAGRRAAAFLVLAGLLLAVGLLLALALAGLGLAGLVAFLRVA